MRHSQRDQRSMPTDSEYRFLFVVLAVVFLLLLIVFTQPSHAADVSTPQLEHGHLVALPYWIDTEGRVWSAHTTVFLAVKLDPASYTSALPLAVDYTQETRVHHQVQYPSTVTVSRAQWTDAATSDGWLILPLTKPCVAATDRVTAGLVTVCPPRKQSADGKTYVDACLIPAITGIEPLYAGTPSETIVCTSTRRRAVR